MAGLLSNVLITFTIIQNLCLFYRVPAHSSEVRRGYASSVSKGSAGSAGKVMNELEQMTVERVASMLETKDNDTKEGIPSLLGLSDNRARWVMYKAADNEGNSLKESVFNTLRGLEGSGGASNLTGVVEQIASDVLRTREPNKFTGTDFTNAETIAILGQSTGGIVLNYKDDVRRLEHQFGSTGVTIEDKLKLLARSDSNLALLIFTKDPILSEFSSGEIAAAMYQAQQEWIAGATQIMTRDGEPMSQANLVQVYRRTIEFSEKQQKELERFASSNTSADLFRLDELRDFQAVLTTQVQPSPADSTRQMS